MGKMSDLHLQMQEDGEMDEQNQPTPDEMPTTGLIDDCKTIIDLGTQVDNNKINYSFRSIFGGQR
jgi:hypothetical protein